MWSIGVYDFFFHILSFQPQEGAAEVPKSLYDDLKLKLQFAEEEIKVLTKRAEHAELEAHTKAEQVSELIILLRERESGTSSESLIRELQKQKSIRDHHIDRLIQAGNSLQEETERLEYENIALREKFSVPKDEEIPIEGLQHPILNLPPRISRFQYFFTELNQNLRHSQSVFFLKYKTLSKIYKYCNRFTHFSILIINTLIA